MNQFRNLSQAEIQSLESQGNKCPSGWDKVYVGESFNAKVFHFCVFLDRCYLDTDGETLVQSSWLDGVYLEKCQIWHSRVEDCKVHNGCRIIDTAIHKGRGQFGFDACLLPGNETGPSYKPFPDFEWDKVSRGEWLGSDTEGFPTESYTNQLGPDSHFERTAYIRNLYADAGTFVQAAQRLEEVSLIGRGRPCRVVHGASIFRSVIQSTEVEGPVMVKDSWIFGNSRLSEGLLVRHSILGPETEAANAEITACLLGGGIGLHHRSLLIAVCWPDGLGNVASGAQVGSNHTGRAANASAVVSAGWFFGLNSTVQFPLDLSQAPFGFLGAGQRLPAGKYRFPFSLYGSQMNTPIVRPGWNLRKNLLAVFRNEMKWRRRLSSRQDFRVFTPDIAQKLVEALNLLQNLPDEELFLPEKYPIIGPCPLRKKDRELGMEIYEEFLENLGGGYLAKNSRFAHRIWEKLKTEARNDGHPEHFAEVLEYFQNEYLT